jgi:hypothetical protein
MKWHARRGGGPCCRRVLGTRGTAPAASAAIVRIVDNLHLSEGVGAAGYQVDLELDGDGVLARGESHTTSTHNAIAL